MIKKFIEAEVKALKEGNFEVLVSSGKVDRLGDTIDPKGWYLVNYKKNPVILWAHSSGGFIAPAIPPVARADKVWVEDGKELKIKGHFAETRFAEELRTLVEGGFLNAVSVGFLPLVEDEKGDIEIEERMYRRLFDGELKSYIEKGFVEIGEKMYSKDGEHFVKQELLEVSWVNVPALATALVSARKEMSLPLLTKTLCGDLICSGQSKEDLISFLKNERIQFESLGDYISIKPKDVEEKAEIKPYANEHSCRLEDPGKYKRFRRENCQRKHDGKCIDVIWGITKGEEEKVEEQALRYNKKVWTEDNAKTHCKGEKGTFEPASEKELKETETKKDKILFEANKEAISYHIAEAEKAINALKDLFPEKGIISPKVSAKGRKPFVNQKSKPDIERLLIMFDKMCEALLRKLRQKE